MLNQTVITGNLGEDPKEFFSAEGVPVTSFDLAFQAAKKKTCWIRVVTFNKLAELCAKHLHKGARIAISGQLDQNKWTDKEGQNRSSFQIWAIPSSSSEQTEEASRKENHLKQSMTNPPF